MVLVGYISFQCSLQLLQKTQLQPANLTLLRAKTQSLSRSFYAQQTYIYSSYNYFAVQRFKGLFKYLCHNRIDNSYGWEISVVGKVRWKMSGWEMFGVGNILIRIDAYSLGANLGFHTFTYIKVAETGQKMNFPKTNVNAGNN